MRDDRADRAASAAGASAAREAREAVMRARNHAAAYVQERNRADRFAAAAASEPETAAALQPLSERGWQVLHDLRWPGSRNGNVDHLTIGPTGVAVLDSKNWAGPIQIRNERLWCGDDDRHEAVDTLLALVAAVEELLEEVIEGGPGVAAGLSPVHVTPILVFTHHPHPNTVSPELGRVRMTTLRHLPTLVGAGPHVLAPNQVALVGEHLRRSMLPVLAPDQIPTPRPALRGVPVHPAPAPPPEPAPPNIDPGLFDLAELDEQIARAASRPLLAWMGFLHPSQIKLVRRCYNGPARVRGPVGTGKTVVMLHRAAWLASTRAGRILVTSFVRTLPTQLRPAFRQLSPRNADKVDFVGVHKLARQLLADAGQHLTTRPERIELAFQRAWERVASRDTLIKTCPSPRYWRDEIDNVIKGRGLGEFLDYEYLERRGRLIALTEADRVAVWKLLTAYTEELERHRTHDYNDLLATAVDLVSKQPPDPGWSAVLIDEVQDLPLLALKLCKLLGGTGPDGLMLVGDGQQALYSGGFTLAEADLSVLGRATVLRINYRNTREILDCAQQLINDDDFYDLGPSSENGTRDIEVIRTGQSPVHAHAPSRRGLALLLRQAIRDDHNTNVDYGEMAILTRTRTDASYLLDFLARLDLPVCDLETWDGEPNHHIKIGTTYRAKGLDFTAVYLPTFTTPASTSTPDTAERESHRRREAFVGRTRAKDRLWIGDLRPAQRRSDAARNRINP